MKKDLSSLCALSVGFLLCQNVYGVTQLPIPIYSGMANFTSGQLGTVGTSEGWANNSSSITVSNGAGSLNGIPLGLVGSTGDKVTITAAAAPGVGTYNLFAAKSTYVAPTNVNIYVSFLYRFDSIGGVGSFVKICQENLQNSSSTVYWDLEARTNNSGQIQLGVQKASGGAVYATTNINVGDTVFIVVRHQLLPGTTDDIIDLWINPPPASFAADEVNVPLPSATTSAGTEPGSLTTGPGRFYFDVGVTNAEFDEFRMATNWAIVTPAFGSCGSAGIFQSPASMTNVAEIADTFTVIPLVTSTAPTYQWQISGAGSSTWTNIPGATFAAYTTPNLVLANDNGNKYRSIVNVPCDGTSATSDVATVTLTAPIVTPPGLVVDDMFAMGIAEPITPVTISNAAWYTSVSANLDIFHGGSPGAPMIATPVSGGSSLWLAYFTPTNNLPVHLAVGSTIVVTLPFIPNSYGAHTNNAGLRFGLFDYADGGGRVVADDASAGGSTGNGTNVTGYLLSVDFGPTFTVNSPLSALVRNNLTDVNLMGSTSDYLSLGSGPSGGGYTGAPAFQAGVQYTLVYSVTRTAINSVTITNSFTGGGTNWTFVVAETNRAYHRFDAFGIRPNSVETSADTFSIPEFRVDVLAGPASPSSIALGSASRSGNDLKLSWIPSPSGSFTYSVQRKTNLTDANWTTLQSGITTTSYTDTNAIGTATTGFYRVTSP